MQGIFGTVLFIETKNSDLRAVFFEKTKKKIWIKYSTQGNFGTVLFIETKNSDLRAIFFKKTKKAKNLDQILHRFLKAEDVGVK